MPVDLQFRVVGPKTCVCQRCGKRLSTNALAKASHGRACKGK